MLTTALAFLKALDPRLILGAVLVLIGVWVYFNYNIMSNSEISEYEDLIKSQENKINVQDSTIQYNIRTINNLKIQVKQQESKTEVCTTEKEILIFEYELILSEDHNEVNNTDVNSLPF